jgi:hypothetical protein
MAGKAVTAVDVKTLEGRIKIECQAGGGDRRSGLGGRSADESHDREHGQKGSDHRHDGLARCEPRQRTLHDNSRYGAVAISGIIFL